jgi:hypothetical protein
MVAGAYCLSSQRDREARACLGVLLFLQGLSGEVGSRDFCKEKQQKVSLVGDAETIRRMRGKGMAERFGRAKADKR